MTDNTKSSDNTTKCNCK